MEKNKKDFFVMFTPVIQPDNSSSDSDNDVQHRGINEVTADAAKQTFYLIGVLSMHCTIRFLVTHPQQVNGAVPLIREISINGENINFSKFISSLFDEEPSPQQLITTTNNYILDMLPSFGYSIAISSRGLFDHIESVEKDQLLLASDLDITSKGTSLHNKFFGETGVIELSSTSTCLCGFF